MPSNKWTVRICRGPSCGDRRGSQALVEAFRLCLDGNPDVELLYQSCYGRCSLGPNVLVRKPPARVANNFVLATPPAARGGRATMYNYVEPSDVPDIVEKHIIGGRPVRRLIEQAARLSSKEADGESE